MKAIHKVDNMAYGLLLAGALNSAITGLTRTSPAKGLTGKRPVGMKIYYGVIGGAAIYKLIRLLAPKTKEEQRLEKITSLYGKAEDYQDKAKTYQQAADIYMKRRIDEVKSMVKSHQ